jgi:hypothetical protein
MKAVIFFSGLAGLLIFGPPILKSRGHDHEISVVVHKEIAQRVAVRDQSRCRYEAERGFSTPAQGIGELRLSAGSGSLEMVGVEGLTEIRVVGRACASDEEFLDDLQISDESDGSTLVLETHYPNWNGWSGGNRYARLDLRVEVPAGLAADITDGSGEMAVSNVGPLTVQDGSGEIVLESIRGDVAVKDGSGEMEIRGISGTLRVEDGSGEVTVEDVGSDLEIRDSSGELEILGVAGSVTLYDSSGEIQVDDVMGDVVVVRDSSGDIEVRGVGGNFVVERDGSGDIRHEGVQGSVEIPRKHRDTRRVSG